MSKLSTQLQAPIKCAKCGHLFKKSLAELKPDAAFPCPGCGTTIRISGDGAQTMGKNFDEVQKAFSKLGRKR